MADRYFTNEMPDYIPPENPPAAAVESAAASVSDSLTKLLHLPYKTLSERLKKSALDLKDTVVKETWVCKGKRVGGDYSLYTGALGTAFLLFKSYQITGDKNNLSLCSDIIKACDSASQASQRVTFVCGQGGVCALGAVVAHHNGDEQLRNRYVTRFKEIKLSKDLPDELLYGRAGFLWASSFINKNIGANTISSTRTRAVVDEIIKSGRNMSKGNCPLMFEWHGKKYWGGAHGLAGIMNVLMDMELNRDEVDYVKGTLHYMIKNRFESGNYPSSEGSENDRLVHWCHGAPGVALTLAKAAKSLCKRQLKQVRWFGNEDCLNVCHGISGNAYVFLSLYQLTGKSEFLYKAKAFACFLYDRAQKLVSEGVMHGGDRPYSLFEGIGGMAYLFLDITEPSQARFPAFEL